MNSDMLYNKWQPIEKRQEEQNDDSMHDGNSIEFNQQQQHSFRPLSMGSIFNPSKRQSKLVVQQSDSDTV
jgi:hypothetical protein